MEIVEGDKDNIDWVIYSRSGANITAEEINELRVKYPKSKFLVATTAAVPDLKECKAQKGKPENITCDGKKKIKADTFPSLDDKLLEKEIT
jgi:hypothetical protein